MMTHLSLVFTMGNLESTSSISTGSWGSTQNIGSNQVKIENGKITINTTLMKLVTINGNMCLPCSELESVSEKLKDDHQFQSLYKKYCKDPL